MIVSLSNQLLVQLLSTARLPTSMSCAPAQTYIERDGTLWIESNSPITRKERKELSALGVQFQKRSPFSLTHSIGCWHELVSLEVNRLLEAPSSILFESPIRTFSTLVTELRSFGSGRLSFEPTSDGRVLLRVDSPSRNLLLRTSVLAHLDCIVYREVRARVWVEVGYSYPFSDQLQPPDGQFVCLRFPQIWNYHCEGSFRELDAKVEIQASIDRIWKACSTSRCSVQILPRLRLVDSREQAELWVMKESARKLLEMLVHELDDRIAHKLSFAVSGSGETEIVVLRTLPNLKMPIELGGAGIGFRTYSKLHHLYLACGTRLFPPLRRDIARQLFAPDPNRITWLMPDVEGKFTAESMPESSFRPLSQWIDYCQNDVRTDHRAWVKSTSLDLDSFTVIVESVRKPEKRRRQQPQPALADSIPTRTSSTDGNLTEETRPSRSVPSLDDTNLIAVETQQVDLQTRLDELETAFLQIQAPLDAPERRKTWQSMAMLHALLNHEIEASLCWAHTFWESDEPDGDDSSRWLQSQRFENKLDAVSASTTPLRLAVAFLFHAAHTSIKLDTLLLNELRKLIEQNERSLPVRLAWLAHVSLHRLSRGDVLALVRARDRILERLFEHGLRVELDLPSFLRFSGDVGRERLLAIREHLARLRQFALAWLRKNARSPLTAVYGELIFALGFARLGNTAESRRLLTDCGEKLNAHDPLHQWLFAAYSHRIQQAIRGEALRGPLPSELLGRLDALANDLRYKGDRLRQFSRVLEPHEKIDAHFRWHQHYPDEIERELAYWSSVNDPDQLAQGLNALLDTKKKKYRPYRCVVLARALELSSRIGEEYARGLLTQIMPTLAEFECSAESRVMILEKGIQLGAHFDQAAIVVTLVDQFLGLLSNRSVPMDLIEPLIGQLFVGLRKFGLRDLVGQTLERLTAVLSNGEDLKQLRLQLAKLAGQGMLKKELAPWKTLIHVAGGWLYFGNDELAKPILNETRNLLFQSVLHPLEQAEIASLYICCLGHADVEPAAGRWVELFRKIEPMDAVFTTDSHFSLAQLGLVETLVLTLASDEFTLDPRVRHWLEDDEYLVRRRIHRDVRQAIKDAGS